MSIMIRECILINCARIDHCSETNICLKQISITRYVLAIMFSQPYRTRPPALYVMAGISQTSGEDIYENGLSFSGIGGGRREN